MYFVYILKDKTNKIYIGYTTTLERRYKEHLQGKVYSTKKMTDPELYYYEAYANEGHAKQRESNLKQFGSAYSGLMKRIQLK